MTLWLLAAVVGLTAFLVRLLALPSGHFLSLLLDPLVPLVLNVCEGSWLLEQVH